MRAWKHGTTTMYFQILFRRARRHRLRSMKTVCTTNSRNWCASSSRKIRHHAQFYCGISVADTTDINGFSRIKELRRALLALDRGEWERSYHQKLFHVSLSPCGRLRRVLVWLGDSDIVACIKWNVATVRRNRF